MGVREIASNTTIDALLSCPPTNPRTHTHIHTYTHTHIHTYTHTHIHTYTHAHIHTYTHTHIHSHPRRPLPAGLVGVDPFYRGLRWEIEPENTDSAPSRATASSDADPSGYDSSWRYFTSTFFHLPPPSPHSPLPISPSLPNRSLRNLTMSVCHRYTKQWLGQTPSELPPWPPPLHLARARDAPAREDVARIAEARYVGCVERGEGVRKGDGGIE